MEDCLNFGQAIEALKAGKKVQRYGWNGKGMYLFINLGSMAIDLPNERKLIENDFIDLKLFQKSDTGTITRLPNINMANAKGVIITGWLASQTDMLAEDWQIVG